jgi:hypothetical protein
MKTSYKYKIIIILIAGVVATSCSGLLDEDPSHIGTADTYFPTSTGFEGGVNACYAQLRTMHSEKHIWIQGTDQIHRGTNTYYPEPTHAYDQLNEYSPVAVNAESSTFSNFWNRAYVGVNRCNMVLGMADKIEVDAATKAKRLAEVTTLRALYYYYLVEQFGDIPFPLEPYEELQITAERTPEETVYAQLISDLEACIPILPAEPDNFGRIAKGAAQFLLSKLYLTRGYKSYKQADDFAKAAQHADNLIRSGAFELLPEFHMLFMPGNEKNKEIIFSVQWSSDLLLNSGGNNIHSKFGFYVNNYPGCYRSNYYNRQQRVFEESHHAVDCFGVDTVENIGRSYVVPDGTAGLANPPARFSYKQDKRYNATYARLFMTESTTLDFVKSYGPENEKVWSLYARPDGKHGELTPLVWTGIAEHINVNYWVGTGRDTAIYIPAPDETKDWPYERRIGVPYAVCVHEDWEQINVWKKDCIKPFNSKFRETQSGYNDNLGIRDMFLFRLGEAYLLAAEAYYQLGNVGEAVNRINTIRRRANGVGTDTPSMMDVTASDVNIDFILDERTRELVGEEHRWVELKRTGKLIERVMRYNIWASSEYIPGGPYIRDYHLLRPIPYQWLSLLANEVAQNPGYAKEE